MEGKMTKSIASQIEEAVAKCWKLGLSSSAAMMPPRSARQLSEELRDITRPHDAPGEIVELNTPFGGIKILTSIYCPPETIYVGDEEQLQSYHDRSEAMYRENTDFEYPT
jgi:hypothetical protein